MTTIELEYKGKKYTLGYTADSVKAIERSGCNLATIGERPISALDDLFAGAFRAYHPETPESIIKEILDEIDPKGDNEGTLLNALIEMLSECIENITKHSGNIKWKMVK